MNIFIYMSLILTVWVSLVNAIIIIYQKNISLLKFKQKCVCYFWAKFSLLSEFLDSHKYKDIQLARKGLNEDPPLTMKFANKVKVVRIPKHAFLSK